MEYSGVQQQQLGSGWSQTIPTRDFWPDTFERTPASVLTVMRSCRWVHDSHRYGSGVRVGLKHGKNTGAYRPTAAQLFQQQDRTRWVSHLKGCCSNMNTDLARRPGFIRNLRTRIFPLLCIPRRAAVL
jgi:hypothetical protein